MRVVAEYRKPQLTGVFLEGSADAVRVPLPGLVLVRVSRWQAAPVLARFPRTGLLKNMFWWLDCPAVGLPPEPC